MASIRGWMAAHPRDGAALQVLVIAPPGERATFEQALPSDARLVFRIVDYDEALRLVKRWAPSPSL